MWFGARQVVADIFQARTRVLECFPVLVAATWSRHLGSDVSQEHRQMIVKAERSVTWSSTGRVELLWCLNHGA